MGNVPGSSSVLEIEFDEVIRSVRVCDDTGVREQYVAPGLIDLQVNGFAGVDFNDPAAGEDQLLQAVHALASTGVTRCFPTVITGSFARMRSAFENLANAKETWQRQSRAEAGVFEGFHMEGPHISPHDGPRGAHPPEHVRPPDRDEFDRMQEAARGQIRLVTLSPEWDGAQEYIHHLVRKGVIGSIGHTCATKDQIEAAVDSGASMSTHLGNGAHTTLPKTQNYIWEQLANDKLSAGFIADGIHLPDCFMRVALRAKGLERSFLVTDAVAPAMCLPGPFALGGQAVELRSDGRVVLRGTERLAGSSLRLDRAVENVIRISAITLHEAVSLATTSPARAGAVAGRQTGMAAGERADFVRFRWDPHEPRMTVLETIVSGKSIPFEAPGIR